MTSRRAIRQLLAGLTGLVALAACAGCERFAAKTTDETREELRVIRRPDAITFILKRSPGCIVGDHDVVSRFARQRNGGIIATIESITGKRPPFASAPVPPAFLAGNRESAALSLKLPVKSDASDLGLFLCSAKGGQSCYGKPAVDMESISSRLLRQLASGKPAGAVPSGVFFFKYMKLEDDRVVVPVATSTERELAHVKKLVASGKGGAYTAGLLAKTESLPLKVLPASLSTTIELTLPMYDQRACDLQAKRDRDLRHKRLRTGQSPTLRFPRLNER